jgi:hypothetical protein
MGNSVKSEPPHLPSEILLGDFLPVGAGSPYSGYVFKILVNPALPSFENIHQPALTMF